MSSRIACPANEVFAWHERPGAFERLQPPWERVELVRATGGIRDGAQVEVRTKIGPVSSTWLVEHRGYRAGREFRDVMLRGPFSAWEHVHAIEPDGEAACRLTDRITYRLPGGFAGAAADGLVRRRLERMFRHRHAITRADLEATSRLTAGRCWRVLVSGASGLVGGQLAPLLQTQGHTVVRLVRRPAKTGDEVEWNPTFGKIDGAGLEGVDAVVHLAGENVGAGRWNAARKAAILSSRVEGTRLLVDACRALAKPPRVWIGASAVGIYGDRGDEVLTEESSTGTGFLADVCRAWERETGKAAEFGARVATMRFGVVLTPAGGALARMLPLFRVGLGGPIGDGRQWMSWISIEDVGGAIYHALARDDVSGVLNTVAPAAVRSGDFARVLGQVLHRPAVVRAPAWALKTVFGPMACETVLAGQQVQPQRLRESGYGFRHPALDSALRGVLGRPER